MSACAPITRTRSVSGASLREALVDELRARRLERHELDVVARPVEDRLAVQERALAAHRHPLLVRAEVVDVAEEDVADRVAVGDRDAEAEVRDAALGVLRAVDRVDDARV